MASAKKEGESSTGPLKLAPAELLAALSYLTDIIPSGSHYHLWRVALVSERVAADIAPDIARDVFYAGLLADIGAVGAQKHITYYTTRQEQVEDVNIRVHTQRGTVLLDWLPGMDLAAQFVASHHEWWNGEGYPNGKSGDAIPVGSRILSAVITASVAGCFRSKSNLRSVLPTLAPLTGQVWPQDVWAALVRSTADSEFYSQLTDASILPTLMKQKITELGVPEELDNEEGVERILHIFAVLVDQSCCSTAGHSLRTARRAAVLAGLMGLSEDDKKTAYRAGLVHDCGRLGVDAQIANKTGRLSDREKELAQKHAEMTIRTFACLPDCPDMAELGRIAGHDHERWDGTGYPDGLAGEDIPFISRILSVVDAYDSMVASQQYRLLTPKGAVVRLEQNAGKQFDPNVVEAMVAAVTSGELDVGIKKAA